MKKKIITKHNIRQKPLAIKEVYIWSGFEQRSFEFSKHLFAINQFFLIYQSTLNSPKTQTRNNVRRLICNNTQDDSNNLQLRCNNTSAESNNRHK